jgi:dimethylhistidine N-methyltransferase
MKRRGDAKTREREPSRIQFVDCRAEPTDILREAVQGLRHRTLPPKLFYDPRGSELFEEITHLPEYYLTRTEIGILRQNAGEIVERLGANPILIELGSGSSTKVRILLDAIQGPVIYIAVDIARDQLLVSAESLAADYPNVNLTAVCADYTRGLTLPPLPEHGTRTVFFPGSNLGNLEPAEASRFFGTIARLLRPADGMLLGVDLKKDPAVLHAAYNDSRGVTAQFNRNLLGRLNSELGADFDLAQFQHVALYNQERGRIEMHLRSLRNQTVTIAGERFRFSAGESIHTENSYKYSDEDLEQLISGSGLRIERSWTDPRRWFAVYSLRVY